MKNFGRRLYVLLVGAAAIACSAVPAKAAPPAIGVNAESAALIDVASGRVLYAKQGDRPTRIASLTKIMTAIVAIENGRLTDTVKASGNAAGKEGSKIYLKAGHEMSLLHMLYGLMLRSGNDAATAIAEHVGGSQEGFVYLMNQKAEELGLSHTHFMNPSGLDAKGHYSSANDVAMLTAYALHNATFREIVKTGRKTVPNPNEGESWDWVWYNKNKMLTFYDGADGVKTGYTKLAKRCLVSSATRGGQQLAVVTLNDPNDWVDHASLLDYGFQHYPLQRLIEQGTVVEQSTAAARSFDYPLADVERSLITKRVRLEPADSLNARLGQKGVLELSLQGKPIGTVPLLTHASSGPGGKPEEARQTSAGQSGSFSHTLRMLLYALFTAASP